MSFQYRLYTTLAVFWTIFSVVFLGVVTAMMVTEPAFPLGLGWIQTRGLAGLAITGPSLVLGITGLILLKPKPRVGILVLLLYSAFWTLTLLPGMLAELPTVVRHPIAYCASGTCTPWVVTVSITLAFGLSTLWYGHQAYSQPRHG